MIPASLRPSYAVWRQLEEQYFLPGWRMGNSFPHWTQIPIGGRSSSFQVSCHFLRIPLGKA